MTGSVKDKVFIVTDSTRGIGAGIAADLAEKGVAVVQSIKYRGGEASFHRVDVSDESDVAVAAVVGAWGKLDILVNNAEVTGVNKFAHEVTVDEWDRIFAINVRGTFLCTKHSVRQMMTAKTSSIVNFSSIYGLIGNDDLPPYHATKGAILSMTNTDAICYAPDGIRVNAVHPGSTKTALFMKVGETYPGGLVHYLEMMKAKHPLGLGEPIDVANCVLFLASDAAHFVTGSSLVCDGGYSAQ